VLAYNQQMRHDSSMLVPCLFFCMHESEDDEAYRACFWCLGRRRATRGGIDTLTRVEQRIAGRRRSLKGGR
jgi:hypothetical protein